MEKKNVLVVVDMQNDFVDGSLGSPEAQAIVDNVVREIQNKDYNYIVYTLDTHETNYLETLEGKNLPVEHCIQDTAGWLLNTKIANAIAERTSMDNYGFSLCKINRVEKNTFGYEFINDYIPTGVDSITVCGLCTDVCVISNALVLRMYNRNVPMYYVEDACAGVTPEKHKAACNVMESCQIYKK